MASAYNPYALAYGQKVQPANIGEYRQTSALASTQEQLDKMTRSRNALIIALAIFVIAFIVCFIFVMVKLPSLIPPPSAATDESIQVISTKTDVPYDAQLADSTTYAFSLLNSTICTLIINAAKAAGSILECNTVSFSAATTGTTATSIIKVALDGKTEAERFQMVADAIVTAAAADDTWLVSDTDVTLV